jgi:hypothetical protein
MNFFVPNGAVANGASAPIYISAEASISVTVGLTLANIGFVVTGSAAVSGAVEITAQQTFTHGPLATITPAGGLYATAWKKHAVSADLDSTVTISAFILRDTYGAADIEVSCGIVAIPSEEIGDSDIEPVGVAITADATLTQHPTASPSGAVAIPAVEGDRTATSTVGIVVTANVYAESGVDTIYDSFATINVAASVTTDNSLVLNYKTITAIIVIDAVGISVADSTRTQVALSTPAAAVTFTVDPLLSSLLDPDDVVCSVAMTATPTRTTYTTATGSSSVIFNMSEAKMRREAQADAAMSLESTADMYVTQYSSSPIGGSSSVTLTEATITQAGVSTLAVTLDVTNTITTRTTVATGITAPFSAVVVPIATRVLPVTSTLSVAGSATATSERMLIAEADPATVTVSTTSTAVRTLSTTSLVDNSATCTIAGSGAVYLQVFPTTILSGSLAVDTLEVVNAESVDPPERTFIRPPYTSELVRPVQEFVFRRAA